LTTDVRKLFEEFHAAALDAAIEPTMFNDESIAAEKAASELIDGAIAKYEAQGGGVEGER
jgi:hypothetical protein